MFEGHWQLDERPFEDANDSRFYYPSEVHQGALLKLRYAIENRRGGTVLAGASGLGKSLLIKSLVEGLDEAFAPVAHIVFPQMPADELMSCIATQLSNIEQPPQRVSDSVHVIQKFLEENSAAGRHAILAIDEAHLISDRDSLEAIRMLLNFESSGRPQVTLFLVGQPSLLARLDRHRSLRDRIGVQCLLRPFNLAETTSYISHRMTAAGATSSCFQDDAMVAIQELTHGVPRAINRLCDLALLIGYAEGQDSISAENIESVCEEMVVVSPE